MGDHSRVWWGEGANGEDEGRAGLQPVRARKRGELASASEVIASWTGEGEGKGGRWRATDEIKKRREEERSGRREITKGRKA